jgi:hypothetical protein
MKDSSFAELYRRSHYFSRHPGGDKDEKEMQRLEEFATAAFAFVLRHDEKLKNGFVRRTCGICNPVNDQFEIEVQSAHPVGSGKFDLVLVSKSYVIVIEAKIWAKLDPHQDPGKDFLKRRGRKGKVGYGCQMIDKWSKSKRFYVVLKPATEPKTRIAQGITTSFMQWCELDGLSDSSLAASFVRWLGTLNIEGLMKHNFENVKLAEFMHKAYKVHSLLEAVRKDSGLKTGKVKYSDVSASQWIGSDIYANNRELAHLKKFANSSNGKIGWFGYIIAEDKAPKLSVWLYATSKSKAIQMQKLCPRPRPRIDEDKQASIWSLIWYQSPHSKSDFEWLCETLNGLKRKAIKK